MTSQASAGTSESSYSARELMVAAAAREIANGDIVFVGMRLPLLAFLVAKCTHAPRAIGLYENGVIRETPAPEMLYTMGDPPNLRGATFCGAMLDVMALLQQGRVHIGFLGAAEVDRFGNLNTTWGRREGQAIRLPGSGGACDIASLAQRTVVLLEHEKRRLVERVAHITSPGYGTGPADVEGKTWRRAQGLPERSGPSAIITTMGVLRFTSDGEAYLASIHPGVRQEEILNHTGWTLRLAQPLVETPAPRLAELQAMREMDPHGFWTKAL
jgi:glutaconate CoA-transferase, subunit B